MQKQKKIHVTDFLYFFLPQALSAHDRKGLSRSLQLCSEDYINKPTISSEDTSVNQQLSSEHYINKPTIEQ